MSELSAHQTGSLHSDEAIRVGDVLGEWLNGDATTGDGDPLQEAVSSKKAAIAAARMHL